MKKILNMALFISFLATVPVPLTGVPLHKLASTLFLLLCIVHTVVYRRKLDIRRWLLPAATGVSFASGLFGMILDHIPAVLILHRTVSIVLACFLAIHIFVFHKKLH